MIYRGFPRIRAGLLAVILALTSPASLSKNAFDRHQAFAVEPRLEEARQLTNQLTPMGAERSGNGADIPDWIQNDSSQSSYETLLQDRPLDVINGENWRRFRRWLTPGQQQLFRQYPEHHTMRIFPTRRTASSPQVVYDNTFRNRIRTEWNRRTGQMEFAVGGIPFPIPENAIELVWNHMTRWRAGADELEFKTSIVESQVAKAGVISHQLLATRQMPFYPRIDRRPKQFEPIYRQSWISPATDPDFRRVIAVDSQEGGRLLVETGGSHIDHPGSDGWQGDLPLSEDHDMFSGDPSMYRWQIAGKQEIYIPYNNQSLLTLNKPEELMKYPVPASRFLRYEKHRVWVLEGTLRRGQKHVVQKRVMYLDEDSWTVVLADLYNQKGQLWRTNMSAQAVLPDRLGLISTVEVSHDLLADKYFVAFTRPEY